MRYALAAGIMMACLGTANAGSVKPAKVPIQSQITKAAFCGIPPIAPIGCRIGPCQCDASGRVCQWTFICG